MPPKGRGAPKPAEFHIAHLRIGKKTWLAGESGPPVKMSNSMSAFGPKGVASKPRKEVTIVGKVLFGRERLAFEVQEVDYSPAYVRKILKKEKDLQDARFGPSDFFGFGGASRDEDSEDEARSRKSGPVDFIDAFRAAQLAPKHSIQIRFQDINRIETSGHTVTLSLDTGPHCYAKPAGEPRTVNMEVVKDITGGAKTITFTTGAPNGEAPSGSFARTSGDERKVVDFSEVQRLLSQHSSRLDALFRGLSPPLPAMAPAEAPASTPKRKRGIGSENTDGSAAKVPRLGCKSVSEGIAAADGSWLQTSVDRFGLKGALDAQISEDQWKAYFRERVSLELRESATLKDDSVFVGASWPRELGEKPTLPRLGYESYRDGREEREFAAEVLRNIRASVMATVASSSLTLDPQVVSRGVFLRGYHINDADEGEPRTVNASARIYAPNGTGRFVELTYENHKRVRSSFIERFSYLHASRGGPGIEAPDAPARRNKGQGFEKIFELDFNESRRKNPTKTSIASNSTLNTLGAHLFGTEGAMSNRKIVGLLTRSVGLGQFGENNGWPIAVARRRFKCGKQERETDTEPIAGDNSEDANVDGCCMM